MFLLAGVSLQGEELIPHRHFLVLDHSLLD